ncbi:MAG: hypothetical protein KY468_04265 [Armatimonadetes bacterium]|nr:hypothetical protein [Armatimonadota bacterium]
MHRNHGAFPLLAYGMAGLLALSSVPSHAAETGMAHTSLSLTPHFTQTASASGTLNGSLLAQALPGERAETTPDAPRAETPAPTAESAPPKKRKRNNGLKIAAGVVVVVAVLAAVAFGKLIGDWQ